MDDNERARHEALRTIQQFLNFANLCGCGPSVHLLAVIQAGLEAIPDTGPAGGDRDGLDVDERADMLLAYMLDAWELTEHGTSLAGAWLTRDGVRLRNALRLVDLDTVHDEIGDSGTWWVIEAHLHPNGYLGDGVHQVGDWNGPRPVPTYQEGHPGRSAPAHIVDNLLAVMRPHRGPRVGSTQYVQSARTEAQQYADRWWAEAFTSGAVYGMQVAPYPARMVIGMPPEAADAVLEYDGKVIPFIPVPEQLEQTGTDNGGDTDAVG